MNHYVNCVLIVVLVSRIQTAPVQEETRPFWDNPCGYSDTDIDLPSDPLLPQEQEQITWAEQLEKSFRRIKHQLVLAKEQLVYKDFDNLYIDVRRGIEKRQYIPNWVPSKGNVEALVSVEILSTNEIARFLPVLRTELQKFAVAFEQIYIDEYESYSSSAKRTALVGLIATLRMLLCEVESALISLDLSFDPPVSRALMTTSERKVPDYTRRMIRDNGVLLKYKDYLEEWARLIKVKQIIKTLKK